MQVQVRGSQQSQLRSQKSSARKAAAAAVEKEMPPTLLVQYTKFSQELNIVQAKLPQNTSQLWIPGEKWLLTSALPGSQCSSLGRFTCFELQLFQTTITNISQVHWIRFQSIAKKSTNLSFQFPYEEESCMFFFLGAIKIFVMNLLL